jgi:hypothetical protein
VHGIVTFLACLLHDVMYLTMYTHFNFAETMRLMLWMGLPGAVYTSLLSFAFMAVHDLAEQGGLLYVVRELVGYRR